MDALGSVYPTRGKCENAALFLQLGLPSTLIRHENGALFLWLGLPSTLIRHENGALFLWLGLPSTLIRHENGAFRKRSSNRRNLNLLAFSFRVDRKHFKTELFENNDVTILIMRFRCLSFPKTQIQTGKDWEWLGKFLQPGV